MAFENTGKAKEHVQDPVNPSLLLKAGSLGSHFEENVERLNRLASLGTLAATMAHEIKNALVAGKTFIDLLLEKNQDAELAEVVRRELGRIDNLVSRMLRFARPGEFTFRKVHLHEILEHSLRLVEPLMEAKPVTQTRTFAAPIDVIEGNEHELQQAFVNLLLNAVEAMGPNGKITVTTDLIDSRPAAFGTPQPTTSRSVQVIIEDTGMGIAEENMKRLFEPFFTTKPTGTGLGLAITRRILQQHQGEIIAKSLIGKGTTFTIILPAADGAN